MNKFSPFLSVKHSKINLVEDDKIISCDDQIAKKFSEHFISISILNMPSNGYDVHIHKNKILF